MGRGGLGEASGGSGGGGFLVDLGDLLGYAFSLQFLGKCQIVKIWREGLWVSYK